MTKAGFLRVAELPRVPADRCPTLASCSQSSTTSYQPPFLEHDSIPVLMGLRMEDLHAPTVASGPTTGGASANGVPLDRLSLMELIKEKEKVEAQMSALSSVLDSVSCLMPSSTKDDAE